MKLSVILCTHSPERTRFARTLEGLRLQTLDPGCWELILVDNASRSPVAPPAEKLPRCTCRLVREPRLGLTAARRAGVLQAAGEILVFVDDDNVLAPAYLEEVLTAFSRLPAVGALGGKSTGLYETAPQPWHCEFLPLLAVRDLGTREQVFVPAAPGTVSHYPECAPIGAGMALRRAALDRWLSADRTGIPDRRGLELSSGGDNDIVLHALTAGWGVAYVPALTLDHLIPGSRIRTEYLGRLNRGIQCSWTQVLARHGLRPWEAIAPWTLPFRKARAWFTYRAWSDRSARIRWQGACGHFEGLAAVHAWERGQKEAAT